MCKELEVRCFLEEAKNLCITINNNSIKVKTYVTKFNKIKDYGTGEHELTIGNGRHNVIDIVTNFNNIKIDKDKIFIEKENIIIESF